MVIRALCALLAGTLAGCGLKGPLYLPETASGVVTRPAPVPPPETTSAPNSPQTVDSPAAGDTPAPEVTAPGSDDGQTGGGNSEPKKDPDKKEKGTASSPR